MTSFSQSGGAPSGGYSTDQAAAVIAGLAAAPQTVKPLWAWRTYIYGHTTTTAVGTVDIAAQQAEPTKPADKAVSFSTYGVVIPISMGKRRLGGNVIESSPIQSEMIGTYDYYTDYQIPITTTTTTLGSFLPTTETDVGLDLTEVSSTTSTERVYQNNDDTSPNYVDVERYHDITLTDDAGKSRTYTFLLS